MYGVYSLMAGIIHDIYCRHKNNCEDSGLSYRGECGGCLGHCDPCDGDGENCGEWQNCDCHGGACGDGHTCKRYIDIEFTLGEFTCQGEMCCTESSPIVRAVLGKVLQTITVITPGTRSYKCLQGGAIVLDLFQQSHIQRRLTESD